MPAPAKKKSLLVDTHVRVVAWLHIALALLGIGLLCVIGVWMGMFGLWSHASALVNVILTVLAILGVLALVEIYGAANLLDGDPAGKPITMVFSVIHLLNFPVGSAISAYSFWVLLRDPPKPARPVAPAIARPLAAPAGARPPVPMSARPLLSAATRAPIAAAPRASVPAAGRPPTPPGPRRPS